MTQKLTALILEKRGHFVVSVSDGRSAVDALEQEPFDMVFMDVQMPEMDGFEATARIREQEAVSGGHIPIIAMTAHTMGGYRERCLAAGMDDYVSKPMKPEDLYDALVRNATPTTTVTDTIVATPPIDLSGVMSIVDGDRELLRELMNDFIQDYPRLRENLGQGVEAGDPHAVEQTAHSLKGAVSHFRALAAQEAAHRLETMGREQSLEEAPSALQRLDEEMRRVLDYFANMGLEVPR